MGPAPARPRRRGAVPLRVPQPLPDAGVQRRPAPRQLPVPRRRADHVPRLRAGALLQRRRARRVRVDGARPPPSTTTPPRSAASSRTPGCCGRARRCRPTRPATTSRSSTSRCATDRDDDVDAGVRQRASCATRSTARARSPSTRRCRGRSCSSSASTSGCTRCSATCGPPATTAGWPRSCGRSPTARRRRRWARPRRRGWRHAGPDGRRRATAGSVARMRRRPPSRPLAGPSPSPSPSSRAAATTTTTPASGTDRRPPSTDRTTASPTCRSSRRRPCRCRCPTWRSPTSIPTELVVTDAHAGRRARRPPTATPCSSTTSACAARTAQQFDTNYGGDPFPVTLGAGRRHPGLGPGPRRRHGRRAPAARHPQRPRLRRPAAGRRDPGRRRAVVRHRRARRRAADRPGRRADADRPPDVGRAGRPRSTSRTCVVGDGATLEAGQTGLFHLVAARGDDGTVLQSTWDRRTAAAARRRRGRRCSTGSPRAGRDAGRRPAGRHASRTTPAAG